MSLRFKNLLFLAGALTLFAGSVGAVGVRLSDIVDGGLISTSTDRAVAVRSGTTDELVSFGTLAAQNGTFSGTSSGTNTGDVTLSGQSYISLAGQALTASAVDLSGSNVTGTLAASHLPTPGAATLGGVFSFASASSNFLTGLSTSGTFMSARPACSNLSDSTLFCSATAAQATAGLNTFSSTLAGLAPNSGGGTANFLRADGTWTAPGGTGTVTTTGTPASGNLTQFSGGTSITNGDLSGDCTTSGTLATTCTKTGGVAFASSATTNTVNASNITTGNLPATQLPVLTSTKIWIGDTANFASEQAISGDASLLSSGALTVTRINSNPLGTTTPTSGNVLVAGGTSWATTTLSGGATLASTGVVTLGSPGASTKGGVNSFASAANGFLVGLATDGNFSSARPTCANLSNAAASCSTDATVATNITSGRLPAAQLPTLAQGNIWIGDTASFASAQAITGDISLTSGGVVGVTKINGATLGTTTATSGNLLVAGGSSWATTAMSGGATMISTGLVTLGNPAAATKGGVQSFASAANNYLTGLTTSGALISARPVCADLSNAAASCSTDATNAANISSGTIPSARLGVVGGTYRGDAITAAQTIVLVQYAPYAFTINTLKNLGTVAGTVTGDLKINTTAVTGCSSLALVSAAVASTSCTAANVVAAGDKVSFVTSSPSSLTGLLAFSMIATRN